MFRSYFAIIFLLSSLFVWSRPGDRGNGGQGVICKYNNTEKLVTLDYFEALKLNNQLKLVNIKNSSDAESALEKIKNRLKVVDKEFYEKFVEASQRFNRNNWQADNNLLNTYDSYYSMAIDDQVSNCKIVQLAINKNNAISIDQTLMQKLDHLQSTILYIHEIVYWVGFVYYKHTNSTPARRLSIKLLTEEISDQSLKEIIRSFKKLYKLREKMKKSQTIGHYVLNESSRDASIDELGNKCPLHVAVDVTDEKNIFLLSAALSNEEATRYGYEKKFYNIPVHKGLHLIDGNSNNKIQSAFLKKENAILIYEQNQASKITDAYYYTFGCDRLGKNCYLQLSVVRNMSSDSLWAPNFFHVEQRKNLMSLIENSSYICRYNTIPSKDVSIIIPMLLSL